MMHFPPRVILALIVLGSITAIGVWGVVSVLRAKSMSESQRLMVAAGIVVIMMVLAAWVTFLWPAYWD